jgi:hypothetical protein
MRKLVVLLALLVLALPGSAFAQTADDVILLAQKGVGEDVLMAFVEASNSPIELSVADIVKLKEAKVADKVVVAMLRRHPVANPVVQGRQPESPVTRPWRYYSSGDNQALVEYQPAVQRVVEVPSTTYVYSGYPYSYDSSYYYPYYYPSYYPYYSPCYYPSVSLGFGFGRSFHNSNFSNFRTGGFSNFRPGGFSNFRLGGFSNFRPSGLSSFRPGGFSGVHGGFSTGSGSGNFRPHGSVSVGGGGGFHGRR